MTRTTIFERIHAERERQREQWDTSHAWGHGDCSSTGVRDIVKVAVLSEECGEVAQAVLDGLEPPELVAELVQVAAVAVAWLESFEGDEWAS